MAGAAGMILGTGDHAEHRDTVEHAEHSTYPGMLSWICELDNGVV